MELFTLLILFILKGEAHMGITIKAGSLTATEYFPREKATLFDAFRYPNGGVCDGTSAGNEVIELTVGQQIFGRTTNGAGHGGGHCAWYVSTDQKVWYKINDKIDCTPGAQPTAAGAGTHDLVLPPNLPADCGTKCVLGWFWSPRNSGGCEIYHDCFDVKVNGIVGSDIASMVSITTPLNCERVNGAGVTPMFGAMVGAGTTASSTPSSPGTTPSTGSCRQYEVISGDTLNAIALKQTPPTTADAIKAINPQITGDMINIGQKLTLPPCSGGDTNECPTYTVQTGDWMSKIATSQGTTVEEILKVNTQITDPNVLEVGDVLKIPPCTTTSTVTTPTTPTNPPAQTAKKCSCSEQKRWCQTTGCSGAVQINQCWGGGPFFYCQCSNGNKPRHSTSAPACTQICSGSACRSAFDVCTLPSSCVNTPPQETCTDGIQNQGETGVDCGAPCEPCQTYQWKVQYWGECDKTCGSGVQKRDVSCVDSGGVAAAENLCPGSKPATEQPCNTQDCGTYQWSSGDYGDCNVPCGQGKQFRAVSCSDNTKSGTVPSTLCNQETKPSESQPCTGAVATCSESYWKFGDWQFCSADCTKSDATSATGLQLREVFCYGSADNKAIDPQSCTTDTKPDVTRPCTIDCPSAYNWKECSLSQCSSSCRGITPGFQERRILCMKTNVVVDDTFCDFSTRPPAIVEGCNPQKCTANYWITAPSTTCLETDGVCAVCWKLDGLPGTDSDCITPKPVTRWTSDICDSIQPNPSVPTNPESDSVTTSICLPIALGIFIATIFN